jgi:NAD(P)-dependent dehydrogenase (short-subunit alcohol dehydrogenase family)
MRTIVVTGSASGIGAATVARLTAEGDRVVGVDRQDADVVCDLGTTEGRTEAIAAIGRLVGDGGGLDGLVTCAGLGGATGRPASLLVSVNYFGTVALLAGLQPLLARGRDAAAVAISSNSTTVHPGWSPALVAACLDGDEDAARAIADEHDSVTAYPATKVAVARWVRRRAPGPAWAGAGIRLNAVAPGVTETPLVAETRADPVLGPLIEALPVPVGRAGRPEEIAAFIAYLLGPDARFLCGSVVWIDGGTDALLRPDDWPARWTG